MLERVTSLRGPLSGEWPEIRNGGAVLGVWGRSPQPPEANGSLGAKPPAAEGWGLGAKPPAAGGTEVWGRSPQRSKMLHFFCKINFIFGLF